MRKLVCIIMLSLSCICALGQKADLRKGNREFRKGEFGQADISYRKGLLKDTSSVAAKYNLGNNLYRQENYDEAAKMLDGIKAPDASACFNRGDVAIAKQDWKKAEESFKESLLQNPGDLEAKENYIYARNKRMEQEQQQQNQQNQDQNQDQDQDQNQDQQQQPQPQDQDQNKDDQQQEQQQPQPQELSAQQAQQLLQAIQDKEKQTQEKVDEKKAAALKSRQKEKNW